MNSALINVELRRFREIGQAFYVHPQCAKTIRKTANGIIGVINRQITFIDYTARLEWA